MKKIFSAICIILALGLIACEEPEYPTMPDTTIASLGTPEDNEIWFTTTDGFDLIKLDATAFDAAIEEVINSEYGVSVIRFATAVTSVGNGAFDNSRNLFNISLPNSVTSIGERAFFECINMECISLGTGLRNIAEQAFDGCFQLHSLHIPSVRQWCMITFADASANPAYCSGQLLVDGTRITGANIPEGVERINDYAFIGNTVLQSVTIPSSLAAIGKNAFKECSNISKVKISDMAAWCSIEFADEMANPLSIAEELYLNDVKTSKISLEGIASISSRAFINCSSIKSLTADNSLGKINTEAFRNCTAMTTVNLGSGVAEIGERAFMGCSKLQSVTITAQQPPLLADDYTFAYNDEELTIYVPANALSAYLADQRWSNYADKIVAIE